MKKNTSFLTTVSAVAAISLCACFLFYKYILQIYPSIITKQLMTEFSLSGAGLGNLAATFYYTYMIMQLLVGFLLDKYSVRWLTATAIFLSALGALLFSQAHLLIDAILARALMGIGVAFATVAYMKIAALWFSPKNYAFISGLLATAAMAGAVFGETPVALMIEAFGWRQCLYLIALSGFIIAFLFMLLVKDKPKLNHSDNLSKTADYKQLLAVLKNKQNWLLTIYSGLAFCPVAVFGGLWGNPFLQTAYDLTNTQAAAQASLVFIGLGLGSPLIGMWSNKPGQRTKIMFYFTLLSTAAISLVIYCHPLPLWLLSVLLFTFGFGLGAFMLAFTIGKELNHTFLIGSVIAMINTSDAILDAITEPLIGKLLDLNWDGKIVNGYHYFSSANYHFALAILPIYLIMAAILILYVKEKENTVNIKQPCR